MFHNFRFGFYLPDTDLETYVLDDFGNLVALSIDQQLSAHFHRFN